MADLVLGTNFLYLREVQLNYYILVLKKLCNIYFYLFNSFLSINIYFIYMSVLFVVASKISHN